MGQTIKVSAKPVVVVTAFHNDIFRIARTGNTAVQTMRAKMSALLVSKYGVPILGTGPDGKETRAGGPTFEQYKEDRAALAKLAKDKGLADDQWVRKPYCYALLTLYGALPVSQTPEALRKAAEREIARKAIEAARASSAPAPAAPVGPTKGETQDRADSETEQLESLIARLGLFKTLNACINLLEADESTKAQATHLRRMAAKAAQELAKAKDAPKPETAKV